MPRNKTPVLELGNTYTRGTEFGAHTQFRDDGGNKANIYGPSRGSQNEAQKDLNQIRAAGRASHPASQPCRKRAWKRDAIVASILY